jgi:hypothetical protein
MCASARSVLKDAGMMEMGGVAKSGRHPPTGAANERETQTVAVDVRAAQGVVHVSRPHHSAGDHDPKKRGAGEARACTPTQPGQAVALLDRDLLRAEPGADPPR